MKLDYNHPPPPPPSPIAMLSNNTLRPRFVNFIIPGPPTQDWPKMEKKNKFWTINFIFPSCTVIKCSYCSFKCASFICIAIKTLNNLQLKAAIDWGVKKLMHKFACKFLTTISFMSHALILPTFIQISLVILKIKKMWPYNIEDAHLSHWVSTNYLSPWQLTHLV